MPETHKYEGYLLYPMFYNDNDLRILFQMHGNDFFVSAFSYPQVFPAVYDHKYSHVRYNSPISKIHLDMFPAASP